MTSINGRWDLNLPEHRHTWWTTHPRWERERTAAMWDTVAALQAARPLPPVVYDIGAEEGDLPALWASWGAQVALFEPDPRVWPNIRACFDANQLPGPLACWAGFAGPETVIPPGTVVSDISSINGDWPGCAAGPVIEDHGFMNLCERPDIPTISLDEAATGIRWPDVITMDVEGAEYEVLTGARQLLTEARPVVFVSVHPAFMEAMYDRTPADLLKLMVEHGYDAERLAVDHEEHFLFQHPENLWRPWSAGGTD